MKTTKIRFKYIFFGFPKILEQQYKSDFNEKSLPVGRIALSVCFILYGLFAVLDYFTLPDTKFLGWIIRFVFICPLSLTLFIFTFFSFFKKMFQFLLCIMALAASIGIIIIIAFADKSEFGYHYYYIGIILIMLWTYTFARIRFIYASIISWLITIILEIIIISNYLTNINPDSLAFIITLNFFLISSNIIGMFACFSIEYYIRNDFLLKQKLFSANKKNEDANKELKKIDKLKNDFIANITHDFRSPLTAILNISHLGEKKPRKKMLKKILI